ncbi:hypothetical protein MC7420_783 [Coleofasciculus chthonoplastes PCC 7420]|uniref:Uncharacterized protein n=1 Tax=Coleofasciculus chthonoplastes PCC 7420 TaxID=118168 RepID=B4VSY5_9CYAN|nr:hypothetical protein [Coleofasciculus chthonoplastes]EDX74909.1 hypothetical protein MC7420_783 [Coleofasciculus chthonoplastes PCC 7420]
MAVSTVVSTFELLVKPLVQPAADILGAGRTIIQGYFLTISNLNSSNPVRLRVNFTAQSPNLNSQPLLAFFDVGGSNIPLIPGFSNATNQTYFISIPPRDTGLFLLQPNVTDRNVVAAADTEIRGFVTLSLANLFGSNSFDLLLTPQQRGTFLPQNFPADNVDFDQLAYALPTATGGSKVTLTQFQFPIFPIRQLSPEILDLDPGLAEIIRENPDRLTLNPPNLGNGVISETTDSLQQVLSTMVERISDLETQATNR